MAGLSAPVLAPPETLPPGTPQPETLQQGTHWSVSTYDVYLEGVLRPDVQVLRAEDSRRYAVLVPEWRQAWVFEGEQVMTLPRRAFDFTSPRHATTRRAPTPTRGSTVEMGEGQWLGLGQRQLVIMPHQGSAGPMSVDELWQRAPLWQQLRDAYTPDPQAVGTFAQEQRPLRFEIAFGTWCGDSRRSVPRLLKTLDSAANPHLEVELLGIGRGFTEPMERVRELRLTNVPTVIVYDGEREIGRFVENPHGESIERDLAALLEGDPMPAPEHFTESDRLLASGELSRDQDRDAARERWRLFATEESGRRLWVERHDAAGTTEVWQRFDAEGHCVFAEVTRRSASELSRTRLNRRGDMLSSTTRGNVSGIVRHVSDLPEHAVVLAPTLISTAYAAQHLGALVLAEGGRAEGDLAEGGLVEGQAFLISPVGVAAPGRLQSWSLERLDDGAQRMRLGGVDYFFPEPMEPDTEHPLPRRADVDGRAWSSPGT